MSISYGFQELTKQPGAGVDFLWPLVDAGSLVVRVLRLPDFGAGVVVIVDASGLAANVAELVLKGEVHGLYLFGLFSIGSMAPAATHSRIILYTVVRARPVVIRSAAMNVWLGIWSAQGTVAIGGRLVYLAISSRHELVMALERTRTGSKSNRSHAQENEPGSPSSQSCSHNHAVLKSLLVLLPGQFSIDHPRFSP